MRIIVDAPADAQFDRRGVFGGMAGAFDRALIAMGRLMFALSRSASLRLEFTTLRQELSARRMVAFGWDLEPSIGGSPSKRYGEKVKSVAEAANRRRRLLHPLLMARLAIALLMISVDVGHPRVKPLP